MAEAGYDEGKRAKHRSAVRCRTAEPCVRNEQRWRDCRLHRGRLTNATHMNLNLGSLQIPLNAATKTFAILAKRGAGKSYTAAVLAEEFFKQNIPFVVFDPIDV